MSRRPSDPTQPQVFGLHHAAYRCRDAKETCEFYEGVLGFPLAQALNRATQHWYTGSARKRVIAVYPGHQVSACHVE